MSKSKGKAGRGVGGKESQWRRADTRRSAMHRKGKAKKRFDTICNGCAVCAMYGKGMVENGPEAHGKGIDKQG